MNYLEDSLGNQEMNVEFSLILKEIEKQVFSKRNIQRKRRDPLKEIMTQDYGEPQGKPKNANLKAGLENSSINLLKKPRGKLGFKKLSACDKENTKRFKSTLVEIYEDLEQYAYGYFKKPSYIFLPHNLCHKVLPLDFLHAFILKNLVQLLLKRTNKKPLL